MGNYYGFVSKIEKNLYNVTVEYGHISDSPYDNTFQVDKKEGLTKQQVNEFIQKDSLMTNYYYNGIRIGELF